jgi:formamidopyrimidine-DNA glycosylase
VPELPEVEALAHHLREHAVGHTVARVDVVSLTVLKTVSPAWTELVGRTVTGAHRHGKHLDLDCDGLHLVVHLARAGWLRWANTLGAAPPKPGRGPLALRVHLGPPGQGPGFDLTEAGTQKRLAVYLVHDPQDVPGVARLGPDALSVTADQLGELMRAQRQQLKRAITDQSVVAGIGNAYSDEILHTAKLSPFKLAANLTEDEIARLHDATQAILTDAVARSVGQKAATLKGEKRSGLQVHARSGLPCPVCGDTVRSVSFADRSFQYCPTCQTEGRELADRRLSKLLK